MESSLLIMAMFDTSKLPPELAINGCSQIANLGNEMFPLLANLIVSKTENFIRFFKLPKNTFGYSRCSQKLQNVAINVLLLL